MSQSFSLLSSHPNFLTQTWGLNFPKQLCLGNNGVEEEEEEEQVLLGPSRARKQNRHVWGSSHALIRRVGAIAAPAPALCMMPLSLSCLHVSLGVVILGKAGTVLAPQERRQGQFLVPSVSPSTALVGEHVCLWSREFGLDGSYPVEG